MTSFKIAHYKNSKQDLYWNGGKLCITDTEIVIKNFFKTVAVFDRSSVECKLLPDDMIGYKAMVFSDGNKSFECLFLKSDFNKLKMML